MEKTFYPFSYIKAGNIEIRTILYSTIDQIYFTIELSLLIQKNCCNFAFACWRQAAKSINIPKMTLKSFLFPLTIIYAILVLPYGFVFAQEEYTCNISVNNIPQVGLKENIFEILGEPDASYVRIFGHWSTVYDDGDSFRTVR